jgi:hypothetical protein
MAVNSDQQTGQDQTEFDSDDMYDQHNKTDDTDATLMYSNSDLENFMINDTSEMSALFTLYLHIINSLITELNRTVKNVSGDMNAR